MNKRIIMMILVGPMLFGCVGKNFPNEYPYYGTKHRHFFDISRLWESDREAGVERFLSQAFVGRMPFNDMKKFSGDVETLSSLLETECGKNGNRHPFCSNVVATLGVIGGNEAEEAIRKFLKKDEVADFSSKTDGLIALGYGIKETEDKGLDSRDVVTALISCINTSSYIGVLLPGSVGSVGEPCPITTPPNKKQTSEERDVVRSAIISLGLSGSLKDKRVLEILQDLLVNAPANSSFRAFIMETLKTHGTVALDGLVCYYERKSRECQERLEAGPIIAPAITSIHTQSKTEGPRQDDRVPTKKPENQRKDQQVPNKKTEDLSKHFR